MDEELQMQYKKRYSDAVDCFVNNIKSDPNVIAVVVCGSLSYDVVYEKSDIDITVIIRDQFLKVGSYCIIEDGITLNIDLAPRSYFKRSLERSIGGSFDLAYYANAKLYYTTDESLYDYFEDIKCFGTDDIALSAMFSAATLLHYCKKSRKWLLARNDPAYAQYWLLMSAESIAKMELSINSLPFNRDGIKKALEINPQLLKPFYQDAMTHQYGKEDILSAIAKIFEYLDNHLDLIKAPVLEYLADRELKTMTMINKQFNCSGDALTYVFDYLAEKGIIQKATKTIRLTPKSRANVEEIAYLY